MPRYDVFLSHASADKPAVEQLARKLQAEGIEPFLDIWCLVAGKTWQEELEDAVRQSGCCAVFFGPVSKGGAWRNQETRLALMRAAQEPSFLVIPVLLPGAEKEDVPDLLRLRTWVDFRKGLHDTGALALLVASIRAEPPGPGPHSLLDRASYRCMAPAREPFVQRSEYEKVRDSLLAGSTVGITTAIHGAGGFGKTALAVELCYDPVVRERYPDGVLWTNLGEEIDTTDRLARVRDLIRWWADEDPPAFETVSAASAHLRQELAGKRVLLVVDDVWHSEDVVPFQGFGPEAAALVTTRDSRTLPREAVQIHVDVMEVPEAVQLLGAGLPAGAEAELKGLAARLGEWPLLLKLVNRQVESWIQKGLDLHEAIWRAENALKAKGLTYFDPKDAKKRSQASALTLEVSLERIPQEEQDRFSELAIFPEDANVPFSVLEKLWGLDSFDVEELASRLFDLSLLRSFDLPSGTIRLHDVVRGYLLEKGKSHLAEWHLRLLEAHRPANGRWPDLPRKESYLWNQLFHHLIEAGQSDLCRTLLLDFHYLVSKLAATDINAALADYSTFAERDEEIRLVRDALRLSAHVLARSPAELRGQLWGRLLDRQEAGIQDLLQASKDTGIPWLQPRKASLTRPGGALIRTIHHPEIPTTLAVLQDGRMVSGSYEGTLRVWDVETGQILQALKGHSSEVSAMAVLNSRWVVSGSNDGTLRVWDVESGQTLQTLEGHSGRISAMAVLDSRRVVSGSYDGTLRVWNVESGQTLQILEGHSDGVRAVAVLDSRRVVSGSDDRTLRVWDMESGQTLQTLEGHSNWVSAVAVLDSCRIISGSFDGTLRVWDVESGQTLQTHEGHSGWVTAVAVLDSRVVSGSDDGMLRVWDVESSQTLQALDGHSNWVNAVAVLDSRRVVSGSDDRTLRVWDVESGQTLQTLEGHSDWVTAVAVLDSRRVVSGSADRTLRVWDVESGQTLQTLEGHSDWISAVAVLDSCRVVSGSTDRTLRVWGVESGQTLQTLEGHSDEIRAVVVLDNHRVVSGSEDRTLRVWDLESGQTLQTLEGHSNWVSAVAVLDSCRVVSGSEDRTLRVWDVESGQTLQTLEGHSDRVRAVAVLDSHRVVSGSVDGMLRVWDVESGQTLQTLEGYSGGAVAVLNNRRIVSGSEDRTLIVWDVEKSEAAECQFTLDVPVIAVAVIPGSHLIIAGDSSGRLHYFDLVESS